MPRSSRDLTPELPLRRPRAWLVAVAALLCVGGAPRALAQGPAASPPALQCPTDDPMCTYGERHLARDGYAYQMMTVSGGADWSTRFWVRSAQGEVLLAVPPLRGDAYLAVQRADGDQTSATPAVRIVSYHYGPDDPAYAPSGLSSTVYHYDAASGSLVADEPAIQPVASPADIRQMLANEGWTLVFPDQ